MRLFIENLLIKMIVYLKMTSCYYPSILAQVYEAVHLIPWIAPLAISAASFGKDRDGRYGKQIYTMMFGIFLTLMQIAIYIFQNYFNRLQEDLYCIGTYSNAFPSIEGFYCSAFVTFIAATTYFWNIQMSYIYWTCSILFLIGPPSVLLWYTYNSLSEILISVAIGVSTTLLYVVLVRFIIKEHIPFLLIIAPFTWFNAIDSYIMSEDEQQQSIRIRTVIKDLEKRETHII